MSIQRQSAWVCGVVWVMLSAFGCDEDTGDGVSVEDATHTDTSDTQGGTDATNTTSDVTNTSNDATTGDTSDTPTDGADSTDDTTIPPMSFRILGLDPRTVSALEPQEVALSLDLSIELEGLPITTTLDGQPVDVDGTPEAPTFTPPARSTPGAVDVSVTINEINQTLKKGLRYYLPFDALQTTERPAFATLPGVDHVSRAWSATANLDTITDLVVLEVPPPQDDSDPVPRAPHKLHLLNQQADGTFVVGDVHEMQPASQTEGLRLYVYPPGSGTLPTGALGDALYTTLDEGGSGALTLKHLRFSQGTSTWAVADEATYDAADTLLDFALLRDFSLPQAVSVVLRDDTSGDPANNGKALWLLDHTNRQEISLSALGLEPLLTDPTAPAAVRLLDNGLRSAGPLPGPSPTLAVLEPTPGLGAPYQLAITQLDVTNTALSERVVIPPTRGEVVSLEDFDARFVDLDTDGLPDLLYSARAADGVFVEVALGSRFSGFLTLGASRVLVSGQRSVDLDAFRALPHPVGNPSILIPLEVEAAGDSANHVLRRLIVPTPPGLVTSDPLKAIALPGFERIAHRPRNAAAAEIVPATSSAVPHSPDALWLFDGPHVRSLGVTSPFNPTAFAGGSLSAGGGAVLGSAAIETEQGWLYIATTADTASAAPADTSRPVLIRDRAHAYLITEPAGDAAPSSAMLSPALDLDGSVSLGQFDGLGSTPGRAFALLGLRPGEDRGSPGWARYTFGDAADTVQPLTLTIDGVGSVEPLESAQIIGSHMFVRNAETRDILTAQITPTNTALPLAPLEITSFASGVHGGHVAEVGDWWATDLRGDGQPVIVGALLHRDTATGDASAAESFVFNTSPDALAPYARLTFDGSPFIVVGVADFMGIGRPQVLGYTTGRAPALHWISERGEAIQIKPADLGLLAPPVWTAPTAHTADLDGDGLVDWISAARDWSRAVSVAPSDGLGGARYVGALPSALGFGLTQPTPTHTIAETPWRGALMQFWDGLGWIVAK